MCFTSAVMETWQPHIPTAWPVSTVPFVTNPPTVPPDLLRELLAAFRKAYEAAETFDRLTGQPDCVDPEKAKLLDRVAELERRLEALAP